MTDSVLATPSSVASRSRPSIFLAALATTFAVAAVMLARGDATGIVNNDDLMRMVAVRDLLAGQSWWDVTQYRLGTAEGVWMHWSRLVDAPIAALVLLGQALLGSREAGEAFAGHAWPFLTLFGALVAIGWGALRLGGAAALKPAMIVGGVALFTVGVFAPGSFDHHNVQIALALTLFAAILPAPVRGQTPLGREPRVRFGIAPGIAAVTAVLMLAIGMETLPYVAVAGVVVSMLWAGGAIDKNDAQQFGLVLAASCSILFVALVPAACWFEASCDAFRVFHPVMAPACGLGLAFARRLPLATAAGRLSALTCLGVLALALVASVFPHCLADPLAGLDPRLKTFWLDGVVEARSASVLWRTDPFALPGLFGMAAVALAVSLHAAMTERNRAAHLAMAAMMLVGLAVTYWQQRGGMFAAALAVLPLALWIARLAGEAGKAGALRPALILAWAASLNIVWGLTGAALAKASAGAPTVTQQAATASRDAYCFSPALYEPLKAEPAGTLVGGTDLGASILALTGHRAIAGPYHRNTKGNLLLIEAMTAPQERSRAILKGVKATIVADCVASPDSRDFVAAAPTGFLAQLRDDANRPTWIERIEATAGSSLVLYRIVD